MDEQYFTKPADNLDEPYEMFDLDMPDSRLIQMVDKSLTDSIDHWNKWPLLHEKADTENVKYWMGEQMSDRYVAPSGDALPNMGNRLQTSSRAVLAYVNSKVANPEIAPSNGEETSKQFARDVRWTLYQHGLDHNLKVKVKKATTNLVVQKRGYLKLRFDPLSGPFGDIEVDYVSPEDVVLDKDSVWGQDPPRVWFKQRCTIEELIMKFPAKEAEIKAVFEIGRGVYSQLSRRVTYWECWFTFYDKKRKEGLCWHLPKGKVILGKMLNPNFIYTGDDAKDRLVNFMPFPPKPLVSFSYMNTGKSGMDETSLFEQAKVLQDLYNKRRKQIMENNDNINGRTVVDTTAVNEDDAAKFFSKKYKAILGIKPSQGMNVTNSVYHIPHNPLPAQSTEEAYDYRNEIDQIMGTPNIFRGEQSKNNTLGQDERLIEQAGALQDDLAASIDEGMQDYYRKLFQFQKVYYTEDHWFQVRGDDGKYDFIVMNTDNMDTNVKISVESGSTMPTNKKEIRDIVVQAANANKVDDLTFWEALQYGKLPDPETIVERTQKQLNDPASFLNDVEKQKFNREAAVDIVMINSGKEPPVRDEYGQAYLEYMNMFIMGNKFIALEPDIQEALKIHLAAAGATAARTANLQSTQVDDAAAAGIPEEQVNTAMV